MAAEAARGAVRAARPTRVGAAKAHAAATASQTILRSSCRRPPKSGLILATRKLGPWVVSQLSLPSKDIPSHCLPSARPPTLAWEVARTVVAQPPIAAKWFGRVFRSCVRLCGGSCVVCVVRVTCVLFYNTPAGRGTPPSQPYTALPWWDGRSQPPYRHTTATFSIIPTHIHTPIGVQSLAPAPATSPHPTWLWLQGTNGHHAPNDTLANCTPPNAHILNPHTGKWPSPHQAPAALSLPLPPLTHTDRPSYSCHPNQHSRICPPLPSPTLSLRIPLARPPPLPPYAPAPTTTGIAV